MRLESGLHRVRFIGGPLDGEERIVAMSMVKFSPNGPQEGTYKPKRPGGTVWKWKEGGK